MVSWEWGVCNLISSPDCPTCGASIIDRFCPHCGEQRLARHAFSLGHYLEELFDAVTHLDSKVLRSVWMLVRRPGLLSVNFLGGQRVRWLSPLRLFVFVSIVYFVSLTVLHSIPLPKTSNIQFNTFATPLAIQLHGNDFYGSYAARRLKEKLRRANLTYLELEQRYDEKTTVLSKSLLFVLIPVIASLFGAFFFRKHRFFSRAPGHCHSFLGIYTGANRCAIANRADSVDISV